MSKTNWASFVLLLETSSTQKTPCTFLVAVKTRKMGRARISRASITPLSHIHTPSCCKQHNSCQQPGDKENDSGRETPPCLEALSSIDDGDERALPIPTPQPFACFSGFLFSPLSMHPEIEKNHSLDALLKRLVFTRSAVSTRPCHQTLPTLSREVYKFGEDKHR